MDLLDKVLLEWSARTEKGYPDLNNEQDLALFESMFGFELNEQEEEKEKPEASATGEDRIKQRLSSLPRNHVNSITKEVLSIFIPLPDDQKQSIVKELNNNSISEFKTKLDKLSTLFAPFFNLQSQGAGRGELLPLLTIKGSRSGGAADKDILVGNQVLEVKELDSAGKFRTGKTGSIRDTDLDANMQTFIKILRNLEDLPEDLQVQKDDILTYYDKTYKYGSGKPDYFVKDVIGLLRKLKKLDLNPKDYIKLKGKRYFYSDNPDGTISLAGEVEDNAASLAKLVRHSYYLEPEKIVSDFKDVMVRYLKTVDFLLLYENKKPTSATLLSQKEAIETVYPYDVNQQSIRLGFGRESRIKIDEFGQYYLENEN